MKFYEVKYDNTGDVIFRCDGIKYAMEASKDQSTQTHVRLWVWKENSAGIPSWGMSVWIGKFTKQEVFNNTFKISRECMTKVITRYRIDKL